MELPESTISGKKTFTLRLPNIYILMKINSKSYMELDKRKLEVLIQNCLSRCYGKSGSCVYFEVFLFHPSRKELILKCQEKDAISIQNAVTLADYEDEIAFHVINKSPFLQSLANNSRDFIVTLPEF